MVAMANLMRGIVVETKVESCTGPFFYSDKMYSDMNDYRNVFAPETCLNRLSKVWVIGIAAGVIRMALAAIHAVGHLFAALFTWEKGHCYHALKGACEFLRGFIEAIPIAGRIFAKSYCEHGYWWMVKIYNPQSPDALDIHANLWADFRGLAPERYVVVDGPALARMVAEGAPD